MDDLAQVRAFRNNVPALAPSPAARARALSSYQERSPERREARRPRALALVPAGVAALALVLAFQAGPGSTPSVAETMKAAAQVVASEAATEPAATQWIYENWVQADDQGQADGQPAGFWTRYDGKLVAEKADGGRGVHVEPVRVDSAHPSPETWYQSMNALPDDPSALLAQLRTGDLVQSQGSTLAGRDFDAVTQCLAQPRVLSPQAHSRLFRALATIPGTSIDRHAAPDLLGRQVISVTFTDGTTGSTVPNRHELLLDPVTYTFRGERVTALEDGDIGGGTGKTEHVHSGQVWFNGAMKETAVVDKPGATS